MSLFGGITPCPTNVFSWVKPSKSQKDDALEQPHPRWETVLQMDMVRCFPAILDYQTHRIHSDFRRFFVLWMLIKRIWLTLSSFLLFIPGFSGPLPRMHFRVPAPGKALAAHLATSKRFRAAVVGTHTSTAKPCPCPCTAPKYYQKCSPNTPGAENSHI